MSVSQFLGIRNVGPHVIEPDLWWLGHILGRDYEG